MNIAEEKEHLYRLMSSLLDERRLITTEILEIRKRINKLDDFQEIGIRDIPTVDYVRLRNSIDSTKSAVASDAAKVHGAYRKSIEYSYPKEGLHVDLPSNGEKIKLELEPEKEEKVENVHHKKISTIRKNKNPSFEKISSTIIMLLKENVKPMKTQELISAIEDEMDFTFKKNYLNTMIWKLKSINKNLIQPERGLYQYITT